MVIFLIIAAALFFCTYELTKRSLVHRLPEQYAPFVHMLAAILGEMVKTLISVETLHSLVMAGILVLVESFFLFHCVESLAVCEIRYFCLF